MAFQPNDPASLVLDSPASNQPACDHRQFLGVPRFPVKLQSYSTKNEFARQQNSLPWVHATIVGSGQSHLNFSINQINDLRLPPGNRPNSQWLMVLELQN
jgi:hypothetical protein